MLAVVSCWEPGLHGSSGRRQGHLRIARCPCCGRNCGLSLSSSISDAVQVSSSFCRASNQACCPGSHHRKLLKGLKEFSFSFWLEGKWDKYLTKCTTTFFFQLVFLFLFFFLHHSCGQLHSKVNPSGHALVFSSTPLQYVSFHYPLLARKGG